jgi:hypothetical protein
MLNRAANQVSQIEAQSLLHSGPQRRKSNRGGGGGGGDSTGGSASGKLKPTPSGYLAQDSSNEGSDAGTDSVNSKWWAALQGELANSSDNSVVFIASETFANLSSVVAGAAQFDAVSWEPVEYASAGPLNVRLVVARAQVTFPDNATYEVVVEYSQQYNFTVVSDTEITFLVPPWTQEFTDEDGYANITVSTLDGPATMLSLNLYYTEDCPRRGWFGMGLSCMPCSKGGYCPGGRRIWPLPGWCAAVFLNAIPSWHQPTLEVTLSSRELSLVPYLRTHFVPATFVHTPMNLCTHARACVPAWTRAQEALILHAHALIHFPIQTPKSWRGLSSII